jgi:type I restriction enzyme S subunit
MSDHAMNAERLLALYERVADAPNAVARLRRYMLDLAVRGKLVEQDPTDESPASVLDQARQELKARAEATKRMRWKHTEPVSADEIGKDVPSGWVVARVNDTGLYINGLAFKPGDWKQSESGIPIIRIQNLTDPTREFNYASGDYPDEVMVRDGDLLVSWSATLEAFKWDRGEGVLNQHIFRAIPHEHLTHRDFLLLLLRNAISEMADSEHAHGLVMTHINRGPFLNHVVLIPPVLEQRRIVAKFDELMTLLDQLEATRTEREATRDRLTTASLARLTAPDTTPDTFPAHAHFAIDALSALTTRADQLKSLRQTILNLAVRGKLVEQEPSDEPTTLPSSDQNPFQDNLPITWRGVRLRDLLSESTRNGYSRRPDDARHGVPILRISAGTVRQDGIVAEEEHKLISGIDQPTRQQYGLQRGDLLACRFNGNRAFVGRLTLYSDYLGLSPIYPDKLIRVRLNKNLVLPAYIRLAGESDSVRNKIEEFCATTVGNWGISASNLKEVFFPVPPLAEQHRIVAKVDALLALCDRLESALYTADSTKQRLLEALIQGALPDGTSNREAA